MSKKVIGIALTGILSLSIGTTFALSNSGTKVLTWYQQQFKIQEQNINDSSSQKFSSSLRQIHEQILPMHLSISKVITDFQNTTLLESNHAIKEHNEHYLNQLHTVTEGIKKQNAEEMAAYTEQMKQQETEQISQDVQDILKDLLKN